jgi:hypothetical protein
MIYALLTSGHPIIKPTTLYTFLWCLWKARNDTLFCRKPGKPSQVFAAANAIISATKLEVSSSTRQHSKVQVNNIPGTNIVEPSSIIGTKIFTDASWGQVEERGNSPKPVGLGICINLEGNQKCSQLLISTVSPPVSSALQAEAFGLLLAVKLADLLRLEQVTFFTDNATLAKVAADHNVQDAPGHWEIRPHLAHVFNNSSFNSDRIFHISRSLNVKADHCAKLALKIQNRTFLFRCLASSQENAPCSFSDVFSNQSVAMCTLLSVKCC